MSALAALWRMTMVFGCHVHFFASAEENATGEGVCKFSSKHSWEILHVYSTRPDAQFKKNFGSCALIGSGASLAGKGLGKEIDSFDTVIRVNRVPAGGYHKDLGYKTDIYFSNTAQDTFPAGETGQWVTEFEEMNPVGGKLWCQYGNNLPTPQNCPFKSTILSRSTKWGLDKLTPFVIQPIFQPPFPVAHTADLLELFFWNAATLGNNYASGGIKAFFATAPFCESIVLYGFAGKGNVDHHEIDSVHDFGMEHAWLRRIAKGEYLDSDYQLNNVDQFIKQDAMDPDLIRRSGPFLEELKNYFSCMGKNHRIHIVPWDYTGNFEGLDKLIERAAWGSFIIKDSNSMVLIGSISFGIFAIWGVFSLRRWRKTRASNVVVTDNGEDVPLF